MSDWTSGSVPVLRDLPPLCCCDDCECHDRSDQHYDADPLNDLPGGWLCWNCAVGQHHEHDPLWCQP
jgi:hypothetical protein